MNIFDPVALLIGETAAYVVGQLVGRTFHLEPKRAKRIGENIILFVIFGTLILVTFIYS